MNEQDQNTEIALIKQSQKTMNDKIDGLSALVKAEFCDLKAELKTNYVSKETFLPVKILSYGFAGILFTIVIGALVSNVLMK
jgi:hypothetical protein